MTDENILIIADVLLKSAFFYGMAGGAVGWILIKAGAFAVRRVTPYFQWR